MIAEQTNRRGRKTNLVGFCIFETESAYMKFRKTPAFTVAILLVFSFAAHGQVSDLSYTSYYYDYKLLNPALAGIQDKHIITTVYAGIPSIQSSHLFYGTYETSIPSIKSGIGALGSYDELAITSTFQGAIFFNRKLPFNDHSGLRLGTQLTYRRIEIDYSTLDFGDDRLIGQEEVTNNFNFDLGLVYYSSIVNIGVSVKDVLEEDWTKTKLNVIVYRESFQRHQRFRVALLLPYDFLHC